nr:transcription factor Ken-like [Maniola hyperantus]XP_034827274.1 transcription factor Ken-like [Maniola hyperantus]
MYCLSWNSHKNNICNGFAQLQQREEFVDMTLVAEGHLVKVHKNLISLASPYIKNLIQSVPCTHPTIFLSNITHDVLYHLLEYMYTGEVCVEIEKLNDFLKAAKELQLPGIGNDLSHATNLSKKQCDNATESLSVGENINTEVRPFEYDPSDAAIDSNINDISHIKVPPSQSANNKDLLHVEILINGNVNNASEASDSLPSNKIQILDNRRIEYRTSNAAIKTNANENILDIDVALSDNASNNHSLPFATSSINGQNANISEVLPIVTDIEILENGHVDYGTSEAAIKTMNNLLHTKVASSSAENNHNDYSQSVNVMEVDDANNFDEFLKFPNPQRTSNQEIVTVKKNSVTSQQTKKLEINDPINKETQLKFSLALDTNIMPQQYTVSNRGSLQMILNRYIYSMHYSANGGVKRRWRCVDYRLLRCGAYVDTVNDKVTERKSCHTHAFHDNKILKKIKANLIFGTLCTALDEAKKLNDMQDAVVITTDLD